MVKRLFTKHQLAVYQAFVPGHTTDEIIALVKEYWNIEMTPDTVRSYNHAYGIKSGLNAKKSLTGGRHSYPSGMVVPHAAATKDRPNRSSNVMVKLSSGKWVLNHRRIWELANGPIPKGHKIIFLDGNTLNYSLTNLALVSDAEGLIMNDRHLFTKNKQLTKSGIAIAQVVARTHKLKRKKRSK